MTQLHDVFSRIQKVTFIKLKDQELTNPIWYGHPTGHHVNQYNFLLYTLCINMAKISDNLKGEYTFFFYKQLRFQGGPKVVYENGQNRAEKLFILVIGCLYLLPNKQLLFLSGPKVVYIYTNYF